MKNVIGLSAVATAGKDSLCSLLINRFAKDGIVAKRFSLADKLKADMRPFLLDKLGVDILSCDTTEKTLVRPLLVEYGRVKRIQSEGKYWTSLLEKQMLESTAQIGIISDIRYDYYPEDEVFWVKEYLKGILVHISRYEMGEVAPTTFGGQPTIGRIYTQPPNKDEAENDPKVKAKADYLIDWETQPDIELLSPHI